MGKGEGSREQGTGSTTPHPPSADKLSRKAGFGAPSRIGQVPSRDETLKLGGESNKRNFFEDVFEVVRLIPPGRVTNYGCIAKYLGSGLSSRMVGWAMNASHVADPPVPAQRVVNRNGMLTGKNHFSTPTLMQELLEKEGIKIEKDTVVEFEKLFWDPAKEIGL
jgi:methylated-DNA-protein-cysteine methyltransferase related protein